MGNAIRTTPSTEMRSLKIRYCLIRRRDSDATLPSRAKAPDHLEDWQEDREDHASDEDSHHRDHERLDERREAVDGRLHLLIIEFGDLLEELLESAGLLADRDHARHHRREDLALRERLSQRLSLLDALARLVDRARDDAVSARLGDDLERAE